MHLQLFKCDLGYSFSHISEVLDGFDVNGSAKVSFAMGKKLVVFVKFDAR